MHQKSYVCCDVRHQSHPSLEKFDALLKQAIQRITNSNLSDLQWIQASLPVRDGGLGVRRVSSLALPAFLASAASTQSLQDDILTDCVQSESDFLVLFDLSLIHI